MRLSTQTCVLSRHYGYEGAVRALARAGFDCYDLSMGSDMRDHDDDPFNLPDYRETAEKLRRAAEDCGISCNQAHAPFRGTFDPAKDAVMAERVRRSIEIAAIVGAENIVIHPLKYDPDEPRMLAESTEYLKRLIPDCGKYGIHIAVENISVTRSAETLCGLIDSVGSPMLGACMDVGHAAFLGQDVPGMVRGIGPEKLRALHVHDNDLKSDMHTLPFTQKIDFAAFTEALAGIGYRGDLTLEADTFLARMPESMLEDAVRLMHSAGRRLVSMFEEAL